MKNSSGFYKRRRGILEHLEAGTISLLDLAVHDHLNLRANLVIGSQSSIPPGICITSAAAIHALCPAQISEKAIQRSLKHLEEIGWIKRWHRPGKHGNYPVLVCRASVHDASGTEYRINGEATTDWRDPKWTSVCDPPMTKEIADRNVSTDREERQKTEPRSAGSARTPDPRHKIAFDSCFEAYRVKFGAVPTWAGREGKTLQRFLEDHPAIRAEEIARRFGHLLASTNHYHREKHGSLAYLLSNFDVFADGPIYEVLLKNKGAQNGKRQGFDPLAAAAALGFGSTRFSD
jgi:hypothetical protein